MPEYNDGVLNEQLAENIHDDPYGTAMYVIRQVLGIACAHEGLMSDEEFRQLKAIDEVVRQTSNE